MNRSDVSEVPLNKIEPPVVGLVKFFAYFGIFQPDCLANGAGKPLISTVE